VLRRALNEALTARRRAVLFVIVVSEVPLDTLVLELACSRNAICKTLLDVRPKLRAALAANGYIDDDWTRSL
jgi:RNA polymerase sigma-70 factor (ECF subfamily)